LPLPLPLPLQSQSQSPVGSAVDVDWAALSSRWPTAMRRRVERSRAAGDYWSRAARAGIWIIQKSSGGRPGASGLLRHRWPQTPPTTSGKRLVAKKNPNTYE